MYNGGGGGWGRAEHPNTTHTYTLNFCKDDSTLFSSAGILGQSIGARNRVGKGRVGTELSYQPANLCSLARRYDNPIPTRFLTPHRLF